MPPTAPRHWRALVFALIVPGLGLAWPPSVTAQSPCRNVAIRSPVSGEVVTGEVPILGSAQIDRFNFYKVEWAPAGEPETWRAVSEIKSEPVINGLLDVWNTGPVSDGSYRLKLTVVDEAAVEVCRALMEAVAVGSATATATETPTPEPLPTRPPAAEGQVGTGSPGQTTEAETGNDTDTEATATLAPIVPREETVPRQVAELGIGSVLASFVGGFCVALLLAAGLLLLGGLRGE